MAQSAPGELGNEVREIPGISGQDKFQGQAPRSAQSQSLATWNPFRSPEAFTVGGEGTVCLSVSNEVPVAFVPLWRTVPG